jgi:hypothetical protein
LQTCGSFIFTKTKKCKDTTCSSLSTKCTAICQKARLQCEARQIEGLRFPAFDDPVQLLSLIQGESITLVNFTPPEVVFAMELPFFYPLWAQPKVTLDVLFQFSAKVKAGFVYQSDGIQAAVAEFVPQVQSPGDSSIGEKMLNAFALKDTFNGVDVPMITLTGGVTISIT